MTSRVLTGKIKWFNTTKGYGFIQPMEGGSDIFLHISELENAGIDRINDGDPVQFEISKGKNGRISATSIKLL